MSLQDKKIVVLMGGGIAAFKAVQVVRELGRRGAQVRVAMTPSATRFVGPVTLTGLTGRPPVLDLWDPSYAGEVHVELSSWADAMVVAPATQNLMARAAQGMADDAVLATIACHGGPLLYAPAMHTRMWQSAATQRVVETLRGDGAQFVGPESGPLASGDDGPGRMSEADAIVDALASMLSPQDLAGRKLLVSAGPTHEDLDPVRFLGNRSTGRMGYAIAAAAARRGAETTLVSGPVSLQTPAGVGRVDVRSARDMHREVTQRASDVDAIVMTAAVADYRPANADAHKLKKRAGPLSLELVRNPDILAELGASRSSDSPVLVGFALETQDVERYARDKLTRKKVDLIVANAAADGFGGDTNVATLVSPTGSEALGTLAKTELADRICSWIAERLDPAE